MSKQRSHNLVASRKSRCAFALAPRLRCGCVEGCEVARPSSLAPAWRYLRLFLEVRQPPPIPHPPPSTPPHSSFPTDCSFSSYHLAALFTRPRRRFRRRVSSFGGVDRSPAAHFVCACVCVVVSGCAGKGLFHEPDPATLCGGGRLGVNAHRNL